MINAKKLLGLILSFSLIAGCLVTGNVASAAIPTLGGGYHIFASEDFSDYTIDPGTTLEGKNGWNVECVGSGSRGTDFTLEDEVGNISNKVLLMDHYKQNNGSTVKLTNERFGQMFATPVSGKVEFSFRVKPDGAEAFVFYLTGSDGGSTTAVAKLSIGGSRAYSYIYESSTAAEMAKKGKTFDLVQGEWNDFYIAADTVNGTFEIKIVTSKKTVTGSYTAYFSDSIGGFRIEIPRNNAPVKLYVDDICAYSDKSEELSAAASYVTESMISNQPLDSLTENIFSLPDCVNGDENISIKWESTNPDAVNVETGKVTQLKFPQSCMISAEITLDSQVQLVKNAGTVINFPVTVLPYGDFTDAEIIEDFLTTLNDSVLTDEPLNSVTKNLKELPKEGPGGMTIEWVSDNDAYLKNDGTVIRPMDGENETVKFTAKVTRGITTVEKDFYLTILFDLTPEEKVAAAKKELFSSVITGERPEAVTKNLTLPKKGLYDTTIEWSSSNEDIITNEGAVTRGDKDEAVTMKAHIMYADAEDWAEIKLTVKISAEAMAEADYKALNISGGVVERSFKLPDTGPEYKSTITWTSDSEYIKVSNGYAVVTAPSYEEGDASVTLTAKVTSEKTSLQKEFYFTVKATKSDAQFVDEVYATLDTVLGHESGESIKDNLSFKTSFANGVKCEWIVSDPAVIESNGEVNNPGVGEESVTVTVTAKVYKNSASKEKTYTFTILPFESDAEILEKAAKTLSFSMLSADEISAVKSQLELPENWRYDTQIEWSTSDENLISIVDSENGKIGLVMRPVFGSGDGKVVLTAKISYKGQELVKTFNIGVKEDVEFVTELMMDTENGTLGETPVFPYGKLTPAESYSLTVDLDPEDETNKVMRAFRAQTDVKPSGVAYTRWVNGSESKAVTGHAIVTARLYIDENTENVVSFSVRSYLGTAMTVTFNTDGTLSYSSDNSVVLVGTGAPLYERGKWLDIKFDVNNTAKKYHFYLDDVLMTADGYLTVDGEAYDSRTGVEMIIYSNPQKPGNVYGIELSVGNSITTHDSIVYLDDVCIIKEIEHPEDLTEVVEEFEIEFLSRNNITEIRKDLEIPDPIDDDFKINIYSDNTDVITSEGKIIRPEVDTDVVLTVSFTHLSYVIYRTYNLKVMAFDPSDEVVSGDVSSLLQSDLDKIVNSIKNSYQLTSLSENLSLPLTGENGTAVTYISSDENVITSKGVITRSSSNTTATLTVTVSLGSENSLSETIDITVRAKTPVSTGGGGSSGGKVMVGKSTVKDTGIDIPQNKTVYFADVPAEHWAYDYVAELYKKGIISRADNFRPSDSVTRAELLKMIICASETETVDGENGGFSDVSVLDWYAPYIAAAKNIGIVNGREDNTFAPNENISRQDAAVICYNAALAKNYNLGKNENVTFSDAAQISDYAKNAVEALAKNSIINGNNGAFSPVNRLTRAEAAAIISRLLEHK